MDILLDHAVGVGIDLVDLVLVDAFGHATATSDAWAGVVIVILFGAHTGEDGGLHADIFLVKGVVLGHAFEGSGLFVVLGLTLI